MNSLPVPCTLVRLVRGSSLKLASWRQKLPDAKSLHLRNKFNLHLICIAPRDGWMCTPLPKKVFQSDFRSQASGRKNVSHLIVIPVCNYLLIRRSVGGRGKIQYYDGIPLVSHHWREHLKVLSSYLGSCTCISLWIWHRVSSVFSWLVWFPSPLFVVLREFYSAIHLYHWFPPISSLIMLTSLLALSPLSRLFSNKSLGLHKKVNLARCFEKSLLYRSCDIFTSTNYRSGVQNLLFINIPRRWVKQDRLRPG